MNVSRPSQRLLRTLRTANATSKYVIKQRHPNCSPKRHASTIVHPDGYKPRSRARPIFWAFSFAVGGYLMGTTAMKAINLIENVERDSEEDRLLSLAILEEADTIPQVKTLLESEDRLDSAWKEVVVEQFEGDTMINESLRGSNGILTPRAFWNEQAAEIWVVVYPGASLCGWPGIVHGGCTATILLEGMGRGLNALSGGNPQLMPPDPSHFGLTYLKPVKAGNFYLLKAKLAATRDQETQTVESGIDSHKDLAKRVHEERSHGLAQINTKYDVDCVLEALDGTPCMKAKGVWDRV